MAYNRRNYLERIIEVQQLVLEEQKNGATLRWIYKNKVRHRYHISYSTFNNYLGTAAAKELKILDQKELQNE